MNLTVSPERDAYRSDESVTVTADVDVTWAFDDDEVTVTVSAAQSVTFVAGGATRRIRLTATGDDGAQVLSFVIYAAFPAVPTYDVTFIEAVEVQRTRLRGGAVNNTVVSPPYWRCDYRCLIRTWEEYEMVRQFILAHLNAPFVVDDRSTRRVMLCKLVGDYEVTHRGNDWYDFILPLQSVEILETTPLPDPGGGGDDDDPPDLDLPSPEWTSNASIAGFDFDVYRDGFAGDYALSNCWDASAGAPVTLPPGVAYEATECEGYTGATRAGTPALAGEFRDVPPPGDLRFFWDGFNWTIPTSRWFWLRNRFTTPSGVARTDWVGPYERRVVGD